MDAAAAQRRGPLRHTHHQEPEPPLLDVFKAAALSLSKLYTGSISAQTRARHDGYLDCIEDLLAFLDRDPTGFSDSEASRVRRWATERLENGREPSASPHLDGESEEDESDAPRQTDAMASSPEPQQRNEAQSARQGASVPVKEAPAHEQPPVVQFAAPSLDAFSFQSPHPYPNIADLDLSDTRAVSGTPQQTMRRARHPGFRNRSTNNLGRGAGSKRKLNLGEIFDIGNLGGKDVFGGGGKRGRYA